MGNYAGVDWAADKHDVLVADERGEELVAATFAHDEKGLRSLCQQLLRLEVQLVAIERLDGLLVERLLDAGLQVLALHPNQVAAARARFRVSGGKSDRFDAFVLCELARTDSHRFRVLEPDSDETKALRALTRAREDLVQARVALASQLRAELERFWPGPIGLFTDLDSPISLAFLKRYPSPIEASALGEQRMAAFLARQRYTGRQKPAQLLAKLRSAPEGRVGEAELAARRALVLTMVAAIKPLIAQIKALDGQIASAISEHPDGEISLSLFKGSFITAAELLAEIGDCRARYPTADALAGDAGQAAVAIESGKTQVRLLPVGLQQTPPRRVLHPRGQHPPLAPVGARPLRRRPRPWPRPPARPAHRRPRLVPCRVALLAEPHPLRPGPSPRPATALHGHDPGRVGAPPRPRCHPADARRHRHPTRRPAGPSAKCLTASRHPLTTLGT
ncbi:MAG: IS110 family transposase [Solirubrobacteraceae bacterium]